MESMSGEISDQLYESLESDNSNFDSTQQENSKKRSDKKISEPQITRQIVFPDKPKEIDKLFDIYKKNSQRIKNLDREVKRMEGRILQEMRSKACEKVQKSKSPEKQMQEIVELVLVEDPIEQLDERRIFRQQSLEELNQIYKSLKKIYDAQITLSNESVSEKKLKKITQSKEVIKYNVSQSHLVSTIRHKQHHGEKQKQNNIGKQYTIGIFDLQSLKVYLSPKQNEQKDLFSESNTKQLQQYRQKAVMLSNIAIKIRLTKVSQILMTSYSHKYKVIFTFDIHYQITVYDYKGKEKHSVQVDKLDEVIFIDSVGDQVIVGTKEGICRVYQIQKSCSIKIMKVFSCCIKNEEKVLSYKIRGDKKIDKLIFLLQDRVSSYDLQTNLISQIEKVQEKFQIIMKQNKYSEVLLSLFLQKNQGKQILLRIQSERGLSQLGQTVYSFGAKQDKKDQWQILMGDNFGSLQMITLE